VSNSIAYFNSIDFNGDFWDISPTTVEGSPNQGYAIGIRWDLVYDFLPTNGTAVAAVTAGTATNWLGSGSVVGTNDTRYLASITNAVNDSGTAGSVSVANGIATIGTNVYENLLIAGVASSTLYTSTVIAVIPFSTNYLSHGAIEFISGTGFIVSNSGWYDINIVMANQRVTAQTRNTIYLYENSVQTSVFQHTHDTAASVFSSPIFTRPVYLTSSVTNAFYFNNPTVSAVTNISSILNVRGPL
jgi:hypothetical protein